ncbi:thiamine phosphate synthase [Parapedobacter tibetensis]|uniref:thiamine phosphate synthase n=1 Tax=Parapedobacter tibetensis TaxID=2972951 RepID=UPI00214DCB2C|nr:thiamine phosphate synthase [Parapedobacter tibetensis]
MELAVITSEGLFDGESDVLNDLFDTGLMRLHLRKPKVSAAQMFNILRQIRPEFYGRIIIHNHVELCATFGLKGVHLSLEVLLENGKPKNCGEISCSAHTIAEATVCGNMVNRVFISPLFDSISKKGYAGNAELLTTPKPKTDAIWVALGGITPERLPIVHQHGFEAAALMGYIWKGKNPQQQFEVCQKAVAGLKKKGEPGGR